MTTSFPVDTKSADLMRILLFILLSVAAHVLCLVFDPQLQTQPVRSGRVAVGYVASSAGLFYPENNSIDPQERSSAPPVPARPESQTSPLRQTAKTTNEVEGRKANVAPELQQSGDEEQASQATAAAKAPADAVESKVEAALTSAEPAVSRAVPVPEPAALPGVPEVVQWPEPAADAILAQPQVASGRSEPAAVQQAVVAVVPAGESTDGVGTDLPPPAPSAALPRYDVNPRPEYPRVAKLRGWEGEVWLDVLVLENGRVGALDILKPSGYRSLDTAARRAVKRWRFKPATILGLPTESRVTVPIIFSLKTSE